MNLPDERFCPRCGYYLHGLAENRCPECGRTFDPNELTPPPRPITEQRTFITLCTIGLYCCQLFLGVGGCAAGVALTLWP
jgi:rubredoxin